MKVGREERTEGELRLLSSFKNYKSLGLGCLANVQEALVSIFIIVQTRWRMGILTSTQLHNQFKASPSYNFFKYPVIQKAGKSGQASEMIQTVHIPAAKLDHLTSIPSTHVAEGQNTLFTILHI